MILDLILTALAAAMAVVIVWRCVRVLRGMHYTERSCPGWQFIAFGLSYVALACSALGAAVIIAQGLFTLSHIGFLMSSAGLILCDRRRRKQTDRAAA